MTTRAASTLPRPPGAPVAVAGAAAALGAAAVAGWLASELPPPVAIGLALALPAGLVALAWPLAAAAALLALVALVPRDTLVAFELPLGGAGVQVTDVLLLVTLLSWTLAVLARGDARLPTRGLMLVLGALLVAAALGLLTARDAGTAFGAAMTELRPLLSCLLVLPLVAELRTIAHVRRAVRFGLVIAFAGALVAVASYVAGGGARIAGDVVEGRVSDDAFLLPMLGLLFAVAALVAQPGRGARGPLVALAAVCTVALVVTFQRGAWLATALAVLFLVATLRGAPRRRLIGGLAVLVTVASAGLVLAAPGGGSLAGTIAQRAASIGDTGDVSNRYRFAEWERALEVIGERPLTGIGLGGEIAFYSPLYDPERRALGGLFSTSYIHNSYVWAALKLGVLGLVALVGFAAWGAVGAWRMTRSARPEVLAPAAGACAALVAMLCLAGFGPHLNIDRSAAWVAALVGLVAALGRVDRGRAA